MQKWANFGNIDVYSQLKGYKKKHITFNFRCWLMLLQCQFLTYFWVDFCPVLLIISSSYNFSNPIINNLFNVQCAMQCAVMNEINAVWSVTAERNFNLSLLTPSVPPHIEPKVWKSFKNSFKKSVLLSVIIVLFAF